MNCPNLSQWIVDCTLVYLISAIFNSAMKTSIFSVVIEKYGWLADMHITDFFVDNHWNRLPKIWQKSFTDFHPSQWLEIIDGRLENAKIVLPLSFICFYNVLKVNSLRRTAVTGPKQFAYQCCFDKTSSDKVWIPFRI